MTDLTGEKSSGGRTLVNALGIPAILFLIFLGGLPFMAFVTVVSVLAVREFYFLGAKQQIHPQFFAGYAMSILIALHYYFGPGNPLTIFRPGELMLIATVLVVLLELFRNKENSLSNISFTLAGIVYIPLLLGTMIGLRGIDPIDPTMGMKLTFCLFVGVWVCDSTAYFVGLNWGRHKLIERISPKKTVEGGVAGLLAAFIFFYIVFKSGGLTSQYSIAGIHSFDYVVFSIIIGIIGQSGDFSESLMKRDMGVKDTSSFLAGHGGVLDRFDSLILASPVMFLYIKYFVY
ncbi:MAG TPA: hypothetical protein EYN68_02900 [Candidatus Marinimicrobia bacterium]|nr:hypothetical protein [Candidatus Neomarinimicrobiota bacterium]HIB02349.1 hypothetical protein [Candidatus Neomarinimicrobiota bacterium]HIO89129.1 hypothetical protein [Candidatus Neomarinimicrobiota bacterium]